MATPAEIVAALESALTDGAGIASVSCDGQTVQYRGPTEMLQAIDYWRSRDGRQERKRPRIASIQLPGS